MYTNELLGFGSCSALTSDSNDNVFIINVTIIAITIIIIIIIIIIYYLLLVFFFINIIYHHYRPGSNTSYNFHFADRGNTARPVRLMQTSQQGAPKILEHCG